MHAFYVLTFVAAAAALPMIPAGVIDVRHEKDRGTNVQVSDLPLVGEPVADTVNSLPVDISVSAPIIPGKQKRHGNTGADGTNIQVSDLPLVGESVTDTVNSVPVDISVSAPIVPERRDTEVDLGGVDLGV